MALRTEIAETERGMVGIPLGARDRGNVGMGCYSIPELDPRWQSMDVGRLLWY